ncbi:MAG TPA: cytochrome c [Phenylobacterium sp.]|nr:cytochrome c [Phenylobacterium sp.]
MPIFSSRRPVGLVLGLALGFAALGGTALAAVDAAKVITARIDNYKKIGTAFKAINDGLKADTPDTKAIAAQAKVVKDLAGHIPGWFPKGSGPETGLKTRAKAEIWTDWATFTAASKGLLTESAKLETIARGGDIEAIKAQVKATGGACGTCHTKFRGPEQK